MNRYILIALLLVVTACDLAVNVDADIPLEEKLVVNSVIHPDSVWYAHVSLSGHILDPTPQSRITNALVVMYENNSPVDTLQPINRAGVKGFYRSDNGKPVVGRSYEIKVSAGPHAISGKTSIPAPAQIKNVEVTETGTNGSAEGNYKMEVKIRFQDNAAEKNFYQIIVYTAQEEIFRGFNLDIYYQRGFGMYYDDPTSMNDENDYDGFHNRGILLKDIFFNGQEKEITLTANYRLGELVVAEVKTLNEDYYNYLNTIVVQETTIDDPLAQPINVYSNIKNGFGIFGSYSASTLTKEVIKRPVIKSASTIQASVGSMVTLTVENLSVSQSGQNLIVLKHESQFGTTWTGFNRTSENTIDFEVPEGVVTGKVALKIGDMVAVSDFELEIID